MAFVTIKRVSKAEARRLSAYWPLRRQYLKDHPLCQITLAAARLQEEVMVEAWKKSGSPEIGITVDVGHGNFVLLEPATTIHHRNKSNGTRRNRTEYWMSAAPGPHRGTEDHKDTAREIGILCPINARPDGSLPDGRRCLTTAELINHRCTGGNRTTYP